MRLSWTLILWSLLSTISARASNVLVLQFRNISPYSDLNWVGESIADTLRTEFAGLNEIVFNAGARGEAMRRLSLRPDADYTRATLIRLGESLDADYLCFGAFDAKLPPNESQLRNSSIRITAQFIDLRKLHEGPEISEAGNISELSRLEEHLAYESLKYLEPHAQLTLDEFLSPQKSVRVDAEESYARGLLSPSKDQRQKWFLQAAALDNKFAGPAFELGKLSLEQKQYIQAIDWLRRIPAGNPNYIEARFKMGLAAYGAGDYSSAMNYFNEVVKAYPLSEVYNDLGAAENQLNRPAAADDFHHALESDPKNPTYNFNLGTALLKTGAFDEAAKSLQVVVDREPNDSEARTLLDQARRRESAPTGSKAPAQRLKTSFNETAFRQLKAMLQPAK